MLIDGPGLKPGKTGTPCIINIDSTKAGKAKLGADVLDEEGRPVKVEIKETKPGVSIMTYYPEKDGKLTSLLKICCVNTSGLKKQKIYNDTLTL